MASTAQFTLTLLVFAGTIATLNVPDSLYFQNKYTVVLQRAEVSWINKSIVDSFIIRTYKYNRTTASLSWTMNLKLDVYKLEIYVSGYKGSNNEYKRTVLQLNVNLCNAIAGHYYGVDEMIKNGNITKCPIKKGIYVMPNFQYDSSKFPPGVQAGEWKFEGKFKANGYDEAIVNCYVDIVYDVVYRKKKY